ncbi:MAG: tRNA uridine-5-carboxymethylaminomethyl(34) synthesis GTPase MnmE [Bdellovibrionales bacterium]|nr:tRNA uridine-5-carboxymethylaminomethyl(34) synthesis GTPase MnmE [Bdellovibrionales bacterium]
MSSTRETTTIAALATAPVPAGIAVLRISGPEVKRVLRGVFRAKENPVESPRKLILGDLLQRDGKETLDRGMAVYMPGPKSFTGEDVAEFHIHGSPLLAQKLLRVLFAFGVVPAEPGEFTKRAFLNGKLDLIQAEAITDFISATSERALKIANEQLHGRLSSTLEGLGEPLRDSLAEIEAHIDFPEEDIQPESVDKILAALETVHARISPLIRSYEYGAVIKEGFRVLLCGAPNAGKSSLLNALLGKKRAIVSTVSGTTRDVIEEPAIIDGLRYVFCDSAGIRDTEDEVEKIGVELARERIPWADLVLLVVDAGSTDSSWSELLHELHGSAAQIWMVTNKIDLHPEAIGTIFCDSSICPQNFYVSALTGNGMDSLRTALVEEVQRHNRNNSEASEILTNERHRGCLDHAAQSIVRAREAIEQGLPLEIIALEIRGALTALEEMVGKTFTEDILGRIFSKFCIGK